MREHQVEEGEGEGECVCVLIIVGRGPRWLLLQTDYDRPFVPAEPARISWWLNPALLQLRPHRMQDRSEGWLQRAPPRHSGAHSGREQGRPHWVVGQPANRLFRRIWPPSPR